MIAAPTDRRARPASDRSRDATALAVAYRDAPPEDRPALMAKLWEAARRTAEIRAKKAYRPCTGCDIADLVQEAALVLPDAAMAYDPSRGVGFLTYYDATIKKALPGAMNAMRSAIRMPEALRRAFLAQDRGEPLGRSADYSEETRRAARAVWDAAIESFDAGVHATAATGGEDRPADAERSDRLRRAMSALPDRSGRIVDRYLGLDGLPRQAFAAIGRDLGISVLAARADYHAAIRDLRERAGGWAEDAAP